MGVSSRNIICRLDGTWRGRICVDAATQAQLEAIHEAVKIHATQGVRLFMVLQGFPNMALAVAYCTISRYLRIEMPRRAL